ncbi:WD40 repeat domain-containing protein [Candidatus Uhrbacteria bacterium]|nr:WD40 repeat domain-containing protein [Candidatus Uhrbacteria bacterium]
MNYTNRNEFKLNRRVHSVAFGAQSVVFGFKVGVECWTHEGVERWGKHSQECPTTAIVFSPEESYVICADAKGVLTAYSIEKSGIYSILKSNGKGHAVQALLMTTGGGKLMGVGSGNILEWVAPFNNEPVIKPCHDTVPMVAIVTGPKGKGFGCASKRRIGYWLNTPGHIVAGTDVRHDITGFGLCADPEQSTGVLMVAAQGNLIEVYDMYGKKAHAFTCDAPVTSLAAHPHGEWFATGHENGAVTFWHPVRGRTCELSNMGSCVDHLAFNSGRQLCAVSSQGVVAIFGKE